MRCATDAPLSRDIEAARKAIGLAAIDLRSNSHADRTKISFLENMALRWVEQAEVLGTKVDILQNVEHVEEQNSALDDWATQLLALIQDPAFTRSGTYGGEKLEAVAKAIEDLKARMIVAEHDCTEYEAEEKEKDAKFTRRELRMLHLEDIRDQALRAMVEAEEEARFLKRKLKRLKRKLKKAKR